MKERLQLFVDNVEKIRLYFGVDGERFVKKMATQLTVRGIRFYYHDYEEVQKHIKANTKWYGVARSSVKIAHAYYVQFAKEPEQVKQAIAQQAFVKTKGFASSEDAYLAAMYVKDSEQAQKMELLTKELIKQPSLKFSSLSLLLRAMLATRPESPEELATTYEQYYQRLISLGWKRDGTSKNAAFLLTIGTGAWDETIWAKVEELAALIQAASTKLEPRHYSVVCLLALAKFETPAFPALTEIHDQVCQVLKAKPKYDNTLLIATQIYTASEAFSDLPTYDFDFADIVMQAIDGDSGGDAGGDGGSGGD
ncbi:DUF4003 family protein [Lysinibacillus sp. LZ02]|uniref:DUF4003 family protein n=1 Tax=Lysinibacillus sp. LZ02 TaxID=3420668 RepID=UPI003D36ED6D